MRSIDRGRIKKRRWCQNDLLQTNFNESTAKNTLKLIAQELVEAYVDLFSGVFEDWVRKAAQNIIK